MNQQTVTSAKGGKTVYGSTVGMLMLDTVFPRIPGDFGNAATWPFPVLYRVVRGASPDRVVHHRAEGLLDAFIDTGKALVADGADGLSTTCGFLSLFQEELTQAVNVPVASSSLMQVPSVQRLLPPGRQGGVITISRESLTAEHLLAAGAPQETPVVGTENGREFTRVILEDEEEMDVDACRQDLLDAGAELVRDYPQVGAIVLECTNMGPHAADLRQAFGLPVFSIITFVSWFQSGLLPRRFNGITDDPR